MFIKTKSFRIIGLVSLVFFGLTAAFAIGVAPKRNAAFADGATGTPDISWYDGNELEFTLTTADQLAGFAQLVTEGNTFCPLVGGKQIKQTVKLGGDIDISVYGENYDGGKGWKPIGINVDSFVPKQFRSIFDGCNYTVSGLYINKQETIHQGLFGGLVGGAVKNLNVEGSVTVRGATVPLTTNAGVGGIVGTATGTSIVNCSFSGTVRGYRLVGGIAGLYNGTDNQSNQTAVEAGMVYDDAIESCWTAGSVTAEQNAAGGIAGQIEGGSIRNCYSLSDVNAGAVVQEGIQAGGIAGVAGIYGGVGTGNQTNIVNCYSTGKIEAFAAVGGIAGGIQAGGNKTYIRNCAALNPFVKAAAGGLAARIAYGESLGYIPSDNISWSGTGTDGGADFKTGDKANETQKTAAEILAAGFFQSVFDGEADGGVWTYAAGKLPGFGAAVDAPSFLTSNGGNNGGGNNGGGGNGNGSGKGGCGKFASIMFALSGLTALVFFKKRGQ